MAASRRLSDRELQSIAVAPTGCGVFRLVSLSFDEGGPRGSRENLRLVCTTAVHQKVVIWGRADNSRNIDQVLASGLPCTVRCEFRAPSDSHASRDQHTHWVRPDFSLVVLK